MKLAIIFLAFCIWATFVESHLYNDMNVPHHAAFESFVAHYGKKYHPREVETRKRAFIENRKFVHEHNLKYSKGLTSFTVRLNHFADLSNKEFNERISVASPFDSNVGEYANFENTHHRVRRQNPLKKDWRNDGAVSKAFDQGHCGSSYAFAALASLEGIIKIKKGPLYKLSEQQIVDCSIPYNSGCDKGTAQMVYKYLRLTNGGAIDTLASYQYQSGVNGTVGNCSYSDSGKVPPVVTGFFNVPQGEKYLMSAVASVGPVATYCDSSPLSFQFYESGVYDEPTCSNTTAVQNHWMTVVGYGTTENNVDYWMVKNSWGENWGLFGFVQMSRNKGNQCCISCNATYPAIQ